MFRGKAVSLVIPTLNEEGNIGALLSSLPSSIDEVVVVDNGSEDKTVAICQAFRVRLICEKERGYGNALRKGILSAVGDIIVCMDADNTYPADSIEKFLGLVIDENNDFVSGQRVFKNNKSAMPPINKICNMFISWLISKFFRIKLKDSQSGMWVFRREILARIMPISPGMGFSQEIKLKAWLAPEIRCVEIAIPYRKRARGVSKFNKFWDSFTVIGDFLIMLGKHRGII